MTTTVEAVRALVAELRAEIARTEAIAYAGAAHARTLDSGDTAARLFESISERLEAVDTLNAVEAALERLAVPC
jgi:hypothetical protein